jgi:hypothetical protein
MHCWMINTAVPCKYAGDGNLCFDLVVEIINDLSHAACHPRVLFLPMQSVADLYMKSNPILRRKKPAEGSPTNVASALMDGIRRTAHMLRGHENSYTSLRGGFSDAERDDLDDTVRAFIGDCSDRIDELKKRMATGAEAHANVDELAHLKASKAVDFRRESRSSSIYLFFFKPTQHAASPMKERFLHVNQVIVIVCANCRAWFSFYWKV